MIGLSHHGTKRFLGGLGWSGASVERVFSTSWALYTEIIERDGSPQKSGLSELLDYLDAKAIPRAVATSTETALAARQLERLGVRHRFHALVGGDQVTNGKPAPDIFVLAAGRLGCAPSDCVVLEDSQPGIQAASAAGMRVIWVPDICNVDEATRGLTCGVAASLTDAMSIIEGLLE